MENRDFVDIDVVYDNDDDEIDRVDDQHHVPSFQTGLHFQLPSNYTDYKMNKIPQIMTLSLYNNSKTLLRVYYPSSYQTGVGLW